MRAKARTQSSIFVQPDDGVDGVLFNASPDILEQIRGKPALQPARALRDTAIAGVVLMDGQIDHTTGLFMLRERSQPLPLWCTDPVDEDLSHRQPGAARARPLLRRAAPAHRRWTAARSRCPASRDLTLHARCRLSSKARAVLAAPRPARCRATTSAC